MKEEEKVLNIDVRRLLGLLWYRKIVILIIALVGAIIGYVGASTLITPLYQSDVMIYVNNSVSIGGASVTISGGELSAARQLLDTYLVILKSRSSLDRIIETTGVKYTRNQLKGMISAGAVNDTEVFTVTITSPDPEEARILADGVAEVLPSILTDTIEGSSVKVIDYAVLPAGKCSPNLTKYAAIGFLIGLVLVCGYFVLGELLDDRVHDETTVTQMFENIPILAVIPHANRTSYGKYGKYGKYGYGSYSKYGSYGYGYDTAKKTEPTQNADKT